MSTGLAIFTLIHVAIGLIAIASGFVVLIGMLAASRLSIWTAMFLVTTVLTSVTGFFFPVQHFMPSHAVGIFSLLILYLAIFSRYRKRLLGSWRGTYVITAIISLYLNLFVLIAQLFMKVPFLKSLAARFEPSFTLTQLAVSVLFIALAGAAVIRFQEEPCPSNNSRFPSRLIHANVE